MKKYAVGVVILVALVVAAGVAWLQQDQLRFWWKQWQINTNKNLTTGDAPRRLQVTAGAVTVRALKDDLVVPWAMVFLPGGELLITEKPGTLTRFDPKTGQSVAVEGVPEVYFFNQGGLFDLALHPDFSNNHIVYLSYAVALENELRTTRLARAKLLDDRLVQLEVLFSATPAFTTSHHFGGSLLFDRDGLLYLTIGDRGQRQLAQRLDTHNGKVVRLKADGRVPADNPFQSRQDARPEIYTYGHRNPQGLALHPQTGQVWLAEHGPQGGDEINVLKAGANYGWPIITYGEEYGGGKIGEGTHKAGMEQPIHYYVPLSIAPAGIAFYQGSVFPQWQGSLLIAALRGTHLNRLSFHHGQVQEERLLSQLKMRLRDVVQGPDGFLYVLSENGVLLKLSP